MDNSPTARLNILKIIVVLTCAFIAAAVILCSASADSEAVRPTKDVSIYNFSKKEHPTTVSAATIEPQGDVGLKPSGAPAIKVIPKKLQNLSDEIVDETRKLERLLDERGAIYNDPEVIEYINTIGKRILDGSGVSIGEDVRFSVIRDPTVNAFAMPTGAIYLHTGILARIENEAQLAFVLGHELSHYLGRDGVYKMDSYHAKTVAFKVFDVVLAPTSIFFGVLGELAQAGCSLIYASSVTGFSRAVESRADQDSLRWAGRCGYDPVEASNMMKVFLAEHDKYVDGIELYFLMNHPSNTVRVKSLQETLAKNQCDFKAGDVRSGEFLKAMTKIKLYNAQLNIKLDRLEHARDNIRWVLDHFPENPEAHYLAGEIYRLGLEDRNRFKYELNGEGWVKIRDGFDKGALKDEWGASAVSEYRASAACDPGYPNAYKGFGLYYLGAHDNANALTNLKRYLELSPDAVDKRYISSIIKKIG